ncbi:carbohydrate kinase family protein [Marinibacterium sp. SX1]|uniref:carbohydrate kinase family protein n=1 Tax=Marinibacterium sp. SX1 TaxID=3388424 RepID=UPI003D178638
MPRPLATVGNVNVDLIMGPLDPWPQPGTEVLCAQDETRVGGAAGNVALAWQALGVPFQIAATTGSDHYGDWLRAGFPRVSAGWPRTAGRTTISVGVTHPDGERTFLSTAGHLPDFCWDDVAAQLDWPALAGGYLLLCGSFLSPRLAAAYDRIFDAAEAHDITVALDTGWPPQGWTADTRARCLQWVARSGVLLLNEIEAMSLTDRAEIAPALADLSDLAAGQPGGGIVVIKRGPAGATARAGGQTLTAAAPAVDVIDTIGAGDTFNAAFLAALAAGGRPQAALEQAVACASRAVSTRPRQFTPREIFA